MSVSSIELIKEEKRGIASDKELNRISRQAPVIKITNMILEEAIKKKSSDILIEPQDKKLRVRFRIDGILQEQQAPPKNMHLSIVSRIKVMSDLNIAEHRLPQDGRFKAKFTAKKWISAYRFFLPVLARRSLSVYWINLKHADIEKLGFSEDSVIN